MEAAVAAFCSPQCEFSFLRPRDQLSSLLFSGSRSTANRIQQHDLQTTSDSEFDLVPYTVIVGCPEGFDVDLRPTRNDLSDREDELLRNSKADRRLLLCALRLALGLVPIAHPSLRIVDRMSASSFGSESCAVSIARPSFHLREYRVPEWCCGLERHGLSRNHPYVKIACIFSLGQ